MRKRLTQQCRNAGRRRGAEARAAGKLHRTGRAESLAERPVAVGHDVRVRTAVGRWTSRAEERRLRSAERSIERADPEAELHVPQDALVDRVARGANRQRFKRAAGRSNGQRRGTRVGRRHRQHDAFVEQHAGGLVEQIAAGEERRTTKAHVAHLDVHAARDARVANISRSSITRSIAATMRELGAPPVGGNTRSA